MAVKKTLRPLAPWAVRQLRRVRTVYLGGIVLWTLGLVLEVWHRPGSRQMWLSVFILVAFVALLSATSVRLGLHNAARKIKQKARSAAGTQVT
ncbi:hypothetical protein [Streptomyces meridianus]|uniref:Uncharacterized protein n=1 Tax=Streptomyces meridianus TaxID=2938945 RepID=A0ABT0XAI4_9ACTN|nr:hypothetical protein [Streptomyces meridianus]MCM2579534.1 hypothetical protein [Streptomyces meridianus]